MMTGGSAARDETVLSRSHPTSLIYVAADENLLAHTSCRLSHAVSDLLIVAL